MSDTLTTLLKGLAEALSPYLPGGDVDDAVQNYVDANFDFADMVSDAVDGVDFEDILSDAGAMTYDSFRPDEHGCLTEDSFDINDYDVVTTDDVRDIVTEELLQTGAVVTVDNILSVLQGALSNAAANAGRAA